MENSELEKFRAQIDAVDDEVMALLARRADLTARVGEWKRSQQYRAFAQLGREAEILRRTKSRGGRLSERNVVGIYREIISACMAVEETQRIAYLGPAGTYSHEAALAVFGHAAEFVSADTIAAAAREAEKENCHHAVAPFENSTEGTVGETMDLLVDTPLQLCGEWMLRIRHNFLSHCPPAEVKTVHAHPQALAQCRRWLQTHCPEAVALPANSNAKAAKLAAETPGGAAIGSRAAAEIYELPVAAADISDSASNTTRFFILGPHLPKPSGDDKTSFLMAAPSRPGALFHLLQPLAEHGVNMTKFESRPARGQLWEYFFFVDIEGHQQSPDIAAAFAELRRQAAFLKILGSYPASAV